MLNGSGIARSQRGTCFQKCLEDLEPSVHRHPSGVAPVPNLQSIKPDDALLGGRDKALIAPQFLGERFLRKFGRHSKLAKTGQERSVFWPVKRLPSLHGRIESLRWRRFGRHWRGQRSRRPTQATCVAYSLNLSLFTKCFGIWPGDTLALLHRSDRRLWANHQQGESPCSSVVFRWHCCSPSA